MEVKPASGFTLQTIACSEDLFPLANSTVATVPTHYGCLRVIDALQEVAASVTISYST